MLFNNTSFYVGSKALDLKTVNPYFNQFSGFNALPPGSVLSITTEDDFILTTEDDVEITTEGS